MAIVERATEGGGSLCESPQEKVLCLASLVAWLGHRPLGAIERHSRFPYGRANVAPVAQPTAGFHPRSLRGPWSTCRISCSHRFNPLHESELACKPCQQGRFWGHGPIPLQGLHRKSFHGQSKGGRLGDRRAFRKGLGKLQFPANGEYVA